MRDYFRYLGKAQAEDEHPPCHLLPYHLMDVAAVGVAVLKAKPQLLSDLSDFLELSPKQTQALMVFGLLLHDLGKMTATFQYVFKDRGLALIELAPDVSYCGKNARHDQLGSDVWQALTLPVDWGERREARKPKQVLRYYLSLFWGHHGRPIKKGKTKPRSTHLTEQDISAAQQWVEDAMALIGCELPWSYFKRDAAERDLRQISWLIAGVSTYCDWVGSNREIFRYHDEYSPIEEYWQNKALPAAHRAVAETEVFLPTQVTHFQSFHSAFYFPPSPLQALAAEIPVGNHPQLFILEDLTGSGKTEAAITLVHRLMEAGAADGFYIGLPTMATSNAMFSRVAQHYRKMLRQEDGKPTSIVLAHGARDMNAEFRQARLGASKIDAAYDKEDETASIHCSEWLADSRKKALLAPVGVGTIDQVLLAALPKKHQPLRALGLYRKVLVLDEVHAADIYMLRLLENIFQLHASCGGSVVLLTATLARKQRQQLVKTWQSVIGVPVDRQAEPRETHFPLLTTVSLDHGLEEHKVSVREGTEKEIKVSFIQGEDACIELILDAVSQGKCVAWVRNSVDEAVAAYQALEKSLPDDSALQLFHSRFVLKHRQEKEAWVMKHFGKESTQHERAGRVLIATQVFQESLDADADVMISDLCLIDDLVQRAGRLHRHKRDVLGNPVKEEEPDERPGPVLIINAPPWQAEPDQDWLKRHSRNTQAVYQAPGKIWLTQDYLQKFGAIRLPEEARNMIEYVYDNDAAIPETLQQAERELAGKERANSSQGISNRLELTEGYSQDSSGMWHDDNADVGTRLGEEAFEVLLVVAGSEGKEPLIQAPENAVELSVVKLSSKKILAAIQLLGESECQPFIQKYPRAKYMQVISISDQNGVRYSKEMGLMLAE